MLELRPNCELCDCDLPPETDKARICTYECTYCADCVDTVLSDVCPKCGGNFVPRPIRPKKAWRPDRKLGLGHHPASEKRVHTPFTPRKHRRIRPATEIPEARGPIGRTRSALHCQGGNLSEFCVLLRRPSGHILSRPFGPGPCYSCPAN